MRNLSYLDFYLTPLQPFLLDERVTDIFLNRPGELWVERLGGQIDRFELPDWDEDFSWRLARQIAHVSHQGISRAHPLLAATLPGGARVQIVAPPASLHGVTFAFRRHLAAAPLLSTYNEISGSKPEPTILRKTGGASESFAEQLSQAVRDRKTIVISGGTGSGKTTLLNSLLAEISGEERLITIEDAPELRPPHANIVRLISSRGGLGEAGVTSRDLLEASLRLRPSRILLGELRGAEAFTFLRAINTGHPGSVTTVHADTPERALIQIALMTQQAGLGLNYEDAHRLAVETIDLLVQMDYRGGRRAVRVHAPSAVGKDP